MPGDDPQSLLVSQTLSQLLTNNFDATSILCLQTCLKLVDCVLSQPLHPKFRQIKLSNKVIQQKIVQTKGGVGLLEAIGFHAPAAADNSSSLMYAGANDDGYTLQLASDWPLTRLQRARQLIAYTLESTLGFEPVPAMPSPPAVFTTEEALRVFNPYQHLHVDGLSQAMGTSLLAPEGWKSQTEQQVEALKQKQETIQQTLAVHVVPRQWKAWQESSSGSSSTTLRTSELDVSSFNSSQSDAHLIAAHAKKQLLQAQAKDQQGFTTKAMRDLHKLQKHKVYGETVLKIHFPDGSGVSGHFAPAQTTIANVMQALLHEVLVEEAFGSVVVKKTTNENSAPSSLFELFTTPPRTVLDPTYTLEQSKLVPAARVHVQWRIPLTNSRRSKGWFIREDWFSANTNTTTDNGLSALPRGVALVGHPEEPIAIGKDTTVSTVATNPATKKKNKLDKEALLLQRMMGK